MIKHIIKSAALALAVSTTWAATAHALTLSATGLSTPGTLPGSFGFNISGITGGSAVYYENVAGAGLQVDSASKVTYTYVNSSAGFNNEFKSGFSIGSLDFFTGSTALGTSGSVMASAGLLPFLFYSNSVLASSLANGQGKGPFDGIAFALLNPKEALVFFNDNFQGDADFNDMIIRVQVSAVPLPGALPLFAAGMMGIGALARRRRRQLKN